MFKQRLLSSVLYISVVLALGLAGATLYSLYAQEREAVAPEAAPSFLRDFDAYAQQAMAAWDVPGMAIGIVKDHKTIYLKGFGVKEAGSTDKVTPQTLFEMGSLAKSFTAELMAMMVDEETLNWDDPVINHLPDFVLYDPWVTRNFQIQDLLSQRSGLPSHAGDAAVYFGADRKKIIHNLRYIKPVSSFRSTYAYQNSFFLVAAEILQLVNGQSWEDLMQQRIFLPLNMKNSNTSVADYDAYANKNALHRRVKARTQKLADNYPYRHVYTTFGPAGGLNSTAEDMTQWLKLQLNEGTFNDAPLISTANLLQTYRRYIYAGKFYDSDMYYGLGWVIRDYSPFPIIWHDGGTAGAGSMLAFIPEENIGIVILTNTRVPSFAHALAWQFFDFYFNQARKDWSKELLEKQIFADREEEGKELQKPSPAEPPLPLEKYTGIYANPLYGRVEISLINQQLVLTMGSNHMQLLLKHWNHDSFELVWPSFESETRMLINFYIDADGVADQLEATFLGESENIFKRL